MESEKLFIRNGDNYRIFEEGVVSLIKDLEERYNVMDEDFSTKVRNYFLGFNGDLNPSTANVLYLQFYAFYENYPATKKFFVEDESLENTIEIEEAVEKLLFTIRGCAERKKPSRLLH